MGRTQDRAILHSLKKLMVGSTDLPVYSVSAPPEYAGIDLSDQRNYWANGFNAVMITDTAFYRDSGYHSADDTADRLDYKRMAQVVIEVFEAVKGVGKK